MLFNVLIAISLLILLGIGVAALFLAGKNQQSSSADPVDDEDEFTS